MAIENTSRKSGESGNILVMNEGLNPLPGFNFFIRVEGAIDLPCRAVRVFQYENEYELIQEGGLNDYVHMRRKPISKPFTFQVERYVGVDYIDPLANGTELLLPVLLFVCRYRDGKVPIRIYAFTGCTVMSKQYGELNAEKSELLVETTTIGYREMLCINWPGIESSLDAWAEDEDKVSNNYKTTKYAKTIKDLGGTELTKDEMLENVKKWDINDPENSDTYAKKASGIKVLSKDKMEARAKKWDPQNPKEEDQRAAKSTTAPLSKELMEAKAKKWDADNPKTSKSYAAKPSEKPLTKAQMKAKAKRWSEDDKKSRSARQSEDVLKSKINSKQIDGSNIEYTKEAKKWDINHPDEKRSAVDVEWERGIVQETKEQWEAKAKKWDANNPSEDKQSAQGAGDRSVSPLSGLSMAEMQAKAVKWDPNNPSTDKQSAADPRKRGVNPLTKEQMEKKAVKWDANDPAVDKQSAENSGKRAVSQASKLSKEAMEERAKKWDPNNPSPDKQSAQGTGDRTVSPLSKLSMAEMEAKAKKWDPKAPSAEKQSAADPKQKGVNPLPKKQMEGNAKKWDANNPNGTKYAKQPKDQKSKSEMQSKAQKWPQKKSAASVVEFLSKK